MKTALFALVFGATAAVAGAAETPVAQPEVVVTAERTTPVVRRSDLASEVVHHVMPAYPRAMAASGKDGYVKLDVAVDATGRVQAIDVISATDLAFADELSRAVRQWQFNPATEPLPQGRRHIRVPVRFVLKK